MQASPRRPERVWGLVPGRPVHSDKAGLRRFRVPAPEWRATDEGRERLDRDFAPARTPWEWTPCWKRWAGMEPQSRNILSLPDIE